MTKTARDILKSAYYRGLDKTGYSDAELESDLKELEAIHQQEIAKEDRKGLEVLGAVLNAAGGEVTIARSHMIDPDKYVIMNYRNTDGSVTYAVTLKEHKEK